MENLLGDFVNFGSDDSLFFYHSTQINGEYRISHVTSHYPPWSAAEWRIAGNLISSTYFYPTGNVTTNGYNYKNSLIVWDDNSVSQKVNNIQDINDIADALLQRKRELFDDQIAVAAISAAFASFSVGAVTANMDSAVHFLRKF
eukprot:TRINITY_DN1168_c0_g1_i1.p1 TRINITY_DN1168_c0_g1~~TRINITY_DN1168_c0_g1_i1.p1  ORF type:complete len:144 (-),score=25.66 TRINITY_DN1168_c0_g1_i1:75-506(-)